MQTRTLIALALFGCSNAAEKQAYYNGGPAPVFEGVSQIREAGNVGGDILTLYGKNFGGDIEVITVVFGSQNARVLSASPEAITVEVPQGPVQGGNVDVRVGTPSGQAALPGGYTYDVGAMLDEQAGYILVTNQWESCLGGVGRADSGVGCEQIAYVGSTGIEGKATFLDIQFPNLHSMYVGWAGGSDISDRWKVQTPGHMPNSFDAEQSFEDLHNARAKGVRLVNQSWADEDVFGDPYWCTDMRHFQTYTYQGGFEGEDYYPPFSISGSGNTVSEELGTTLLADATRSDGSCLESEGRRLSDLRELQFCEVGDYIKQRTYEFETSWNAGEPFFVGLDQTEDGAVLNSLAAVDILVDVPGIGLETVVKVPPPIVVQGSAGFDDPGVGSDELWGLMELSSCADTNEDGVFDSDDAALRFQWEPYVMPLADGDGIKASRTQVKFTITVLDIGWFGGVGSPIRATITVPDENEYDPVTELSTLEVPVWVMYQFPSVDASWGGESLVAGSTSVSWGDPTRVDYGYLVLTVDRTTEYTLEADGLDGDVVFAYSSGDFGFLSWSNPLDGDQPCADCNDNDGDGWIDADDPDCLAGELENNSELGKSTCNDGIDNDGDGLVDAEDDDCDDGSDIESTECGDQVDNDGDGWVDLEDLDCQGGLFEDNHTFGDFSCNDLIDNDGDGWFDRDDPACESADFDEDDGFTDAQCNDGIDNDGHGDVDSEDTMCAQRGASYEFEQRELEGECVDGEDNDLDGYTDSNDPDCEFNPWSFERRPFRDPLEYPGIDQCYDGVDNDEDGAADALDPGCWNAEGIADGFIDDESLAEFIPPPEDTGSAEDSGL